MPGHVALQDANVSHVLHPRKEAHCWPGWAPSSPHMQPAMASPSPSGVNPPCRLFLPALRKLTTPSQKPSMTKWVARLGSWESGADRAGRGELWPPPPPLHPPLGISCPAITYLKPPESGHCRRPQTCPPATVKWKDPISDSDAQQRIQAQEVLLSIVGKGRPRST